MKNSSHNKRRQRHKARLKKNSTLNLTALMDIFTILVFFLLVNSSDVEVLEANKDIKLPESLAEEKPEETIVVMVNNTELIVQGKKVADVELVLQSEDVEIAALAEELAYHAAKRPELTEEEEEKGRSVTVMGDKDVPYQLLKRVMTTCAKAEFRDIALAVNKLEVPEPDPESLQTLQSLSELESG
ncbi:MAG: ExbD/TolR family protein [Pseudomonadales bacterium]